jgi:hypothetical protein
MWSQVVAEASGLSANVVAFGRSPGHPAASATLSQAS